MATATLRSESPPRPRTGGTVSTASDHSIRDEHRTPASASTQTVNSSIHSRPASQSKRSSRSNRRSRSRNESRALTFESDLESGSDMEEISRPAIFNNVDRGAPGDAALIAMTKRDPEEVRAQKRKSQFYSEVFAYRETGTSPKERVGKDSVVCAHVKTNVIIEDEYSLMTDLSAFLSVRYSRPASSIMVSVEHSACLLFGGSFDPAYYITISALPSQVQSATNKRNAALLQTFLADELHVERHRGVVKFEAVPEECLATNGLTCQAEIEAMAKKAGSNAHQRNNSDESKAGAKKSGRLSVVPEALKSRSKEDLKSPGLSKSPLREGVGNLPDLGKRKSPAEIKADKMHKKKSFMQLFGR